MTVGSVKTHFSAHLPGIVFFFNPKSFFRDQAGLVFEPTGYLV